MINVQVQVVDQQSIKHTTISTKIYHKNTVITIMLHKVSKVEKNNILNKVESY
jgi:hypothetical protein